MRVIGESIVWSLAMVPAPRPALALRVVALRLLLPRKLAELPLDRLLEELTPPKAASKRADADADSGDTALIVRVTDALLRERKLLGTTCLYRALIRYVLFREAGLDVTFVMGVRKRGEELVGHAWLERDDGPFLEEIKDEYTRTFSHPRADA